MIKATRKPRIIKGDSRGAFFDLFEADQATALAIRARLLRSLQGWLKTAGTQIVAAKGLGITQARVSDIKRGK